MLSVDSMHATYNMSLMYAIVWTINSHYASDSTKPLSIVHFATLDTSRGFHNDLIDAVLGLASSAGRIKFLLESERVANNETDEAAGGEGGAHQPEDYNGGLNTQTTAIWFVDSWRAYKRLERRLLRPDNRTSTFKRNGYYCLIYTGLESGRLETIRRIFSRLLAIYVINVNVFLSQRETGMVQVYNYYPYRSHLCQSAQPVHYATFPGSLGAAPQILLEDRTLFFDDKLDNMHGCELVIVTFTQRPYVIINQDESVSGIEGLLFQLLEERMNFSTRLLIEKDHNRGVMLSNGSLTGAMRLIVEGKANLTFGAFMYSRERKRFMQPSLTYTSFPVVLCIPTGRQLSPLQRLTKPLRYIIWICLLVSLLLGCMVICFLHTDRGIHVRRFLLGGNRWPCMSLWSILFGGQQQQLPRRNFARYLLALWLLETLVIRAAYTGELYILLQDARVRTPLRTLTEVLEQNYMFHMLPAMQSVFRDMLPLKNVQIITDLDKSLRQLRDDDQARIVLSTLQPTVARFDMESGRSKPRLTVLPTPLLTAPLTFYMRPHSYLKQRINSLFMSMMSSGLVHRSRRIYLDRIEHLAKVRNREPTRLSMWLMSGIFGCFGLLHLLACFVFMLEIRSSAPQRQFLRRLMDTANRFTA